MDILLPTTFYLLTFYIELVGFFLKSFMLKIIYAHYKRIKINSIHHQIKRQMI